MVLSIVEEGSGLLNEDLSKAPPSAWKKFIAVSLWTNLILAGLVIFQTLLHNHHCLNMNHEVRTDFDSYGLDPSLLNFPSHLSESTKLNRKEARLTHLIIPFHPKQLSNVYDLLQVFNHFQPCRLLQDSEEDLCGTSQRAFKDKTGYFQRNQTIPLGHQIKLVFYLSVVPDEYLKQKLWARFKQLDVSVRKCFTSFQIVYLDIAKRHNDHVIGSRLMFEALINKKIQGIEDVQYIYLMEPDCRPIKPYWLSIVDSMTRYPNPEFWMKGSIFRGPPKLIGDGDIFHFAHINGNALYNLADRRLTEYYFKEVRPFIKMHYEDGGYDADFFRLLWAESKWERNREVAHFFQFSEFVQNHWHGIWEMYTIRNGSDTTALVHGGFANDQDYLDDSNPLFVYKQNDDT